MVASVSGTSINTLKEFSASASSPSNLTEQVRWLGPWLELNTNRLTPLSQFRTVAPTMASWSQSLWAKTGKAALASFAGMCSFPGGYPGTFLSVPFFCSSYALSLSSTVAPIYYYYDLVCCTVPAFPGFVFLHYFLLASWLVLVVTLLHPLLFLLHTSTVFCIASTPHQSYPS